MVTGGEVVRWGGGVVGRWGGGVAGWCIVRGVVRSWGGGECCEPRAPYDGTRHIL